ncbi:MAG: hypothetical protein HRU12_21975 [Phaeodactylibacter sp.]|nr:hypothetical protein [Phaeodactylibacter sp.]
MIDQLEYFKHIHESELKRRDDIAARYPFVLAVFALNAGVLKFSLEGLLGLIGKMPLECGSVLLYCWLFWLFGLGVLVYSFACFVLCIFGFKYKHLPQPLEMKNAWDQLIEYYKKYPTAGDGLVMVKSEMVKMYSENADYNMANNHTKSKYYNKTLMFNAVSMVLILAASTAPYLQQIFNL